MILAAGLGTRLRPVTEHYAKPVVPFLNIPLLFFPLTLLDEAGVDTLVINTHYLPKQVEQLAQNIPGNGFKVTMTHESGAPLGSGGGIWNARKNLEGDGDFMVCNGDEVILPKEPEIMSDFVAAHKSNGALATILVMEHDKVGSQFGGVWADDSGTVKGFGKNGSAFGKDLKGYHYIGLLLLKDRIFQYLPNGESNILYDALTAAIQAGEKVQVLVRKFVWHETGNPVDFVRATREVISLLDGGTGIESEYLKKICTRYWPKGTRFTRESGALVLRAPTAVLSHEASIAGCLIMDNHTVIPAGANVADAILLNGAKLDFSSRVSGEIVI